MIKAQWVQAGAQSTWGLFVTFPTGLKAVVFVDQLHSGDAMSLVRQTLGEVILDPDRTTAEHVFEDLVTLFRR